MKKNFRAIVLVTIAAFALVACNPLGKMVKNASTVKYDVDPNPIRMDGDTVAINISGKFPEKYFHKMVTAEAVPVLVYPATGENQKTKELKAITFHGESAEGEGNKVNFEKGGSFSYDDIVAYEKGMESAVVQLKLKGTYKGKEKEFPEVKVADGTIITPLLVKIDARPIQTGHKFTKKTSETLSADIHYLIQSPQVRSKELRADDIKALSADIKAGSENPRVEYKGVSVSAYASPDGELSKNENLANDRAKSASKAINKFFKKAKVEAAKADGFYTNTGKGEDWDGFKSAMQKSEVQDKDLIIRILEMYSDGEKREQEIKNLAKTYVEVAKDILPQLRRSMITVNYDLMSKTDEEIKALAANNPDSLNVEELLYCGLELTEDLNGKLKVFQECARVHANDWRASNNAGYTLLMQNKVADAQAEFEKAQKLDDNGTVKNNLAVCAHLMGDRAKAKALLQSASSSGNEVNYNLGIINIQEGDYASATSNMAGENTFNSALAKLLNGDNDGALNVLDASEDKSSAEGYYLKAIIGSRKKSIDLLTQNLKTAISKDASYKEKAKTDAEFISYREDSNFKALVE